MLVVDVGVLPNHKHDFSPEKFCDVSHCGKSRLKHGRRASTSMQAVVFVYFNERLPVTENDIAYESEELAL
jgi:hypothetical protein